MPNFVRGRQVVSPGVRLGGNRRPSDSIVLGPLGTGVGQTVVTGGPPDVPDGTIPRISVELALRSAPNSFTYEFELAPYILELEIERGRQDLLPGIAQPGKCVLILDNQDRLFDPLNTASPLYPYILPARGIRVIAWWNGVSYTLFTGDIEGWPQNWSGRSNTVTLTAMDGLDFLNTVDVPSTLAISSDTTGNQFAAALDAVSWPTFARAVDAGNDVCVAQTAGAITNAYSFGETLADTEQGYLFANVYNYITFLQRLRSQQTPYNTVQMYLSNHPDYVTTWPFENVSDPDYTYRTLRNDVIVTPPSGTKHEAYDQTSIDAYRRRTISVSTYHLNEGVCDDMALFILGRMKDPQLYIKGLVVAGQESSSAMWPLVLARDLADRINVEIYPPGNPTTSVNQNCTIQYIKHHYEPGRFETTFDTIPVAAQNPPWWLGITGSSEMGTTSYLQY